MKILFFDDSRSNRDFVIEELEPYAVDALVTSSWDEAEEFIRANQEVEDVFIFLDWQIEKMNETVTTKPLVELAVQLGYEPYVVTNDLEDPSLWDLELVKIIQAGVIPQEHVSASWDISKGKRILNILREKNTELKLKNL